MLLIRADSSQEIGAGHALRCLALGQAWSDLGGQVVWLSAESESLPSVQRRIEREPIQLVALPPTIAPWSDEDASFTRSLAERSSACWIIVDDYRLTEKQREHLLESPSRLLRLVDQEDRPSMPREWILNQNPQEYDCLESDRAFLGTKYALLRREFRTIDHSKRAFPVVASRILVTLGGSPGQDIVDLCSELFHELARGELADLEVVFAGVDQLPRLESDIHSQRALGAVEDMVSLMTWADLAICAGGSTCWELCAARVPFLVMILAENQRGNAVRLDQAGCAINLGDFASADRSVWKREIRDLILDPARRSRLSRDAGQLVDARGAYRVCERLRSLVA